MKTSTIRSETNRNGKLRQMLAGLRDETYERVRELRKEQAGDAELEPSDEMDKARATGETETHAGLIARAEERLRYIDEALGRAEKGRYGICAGCSEPIPLARLRALPFAIYCVECQRKRRVPAHGWTDGGTIQPYDQQWNLPEEMKEQPEYTPASEEVLSVSYGSPFAEGNASEASRAVPKPKTLPRKK